MGSIFGSVENIRHEAPYTGNRDSGVILGHVPRSRLLDAKPRPACLREGGCRPASLPRVGLGEVIELDLNAAQRLVSNE